MKPALNSVLENRDPLRMAIASIVSKALRATLLAQTFLNRQL